MSNLERNYSRGREVRTALHRVAESIFGIRIARDGDIRPQRPAMVPWVSAGMIVCQEAPEKTSRSKIDTSLVMAA